jgi:hypothetical protein
VAGIFFSRRQEVFNSLGIKQKGRLPKQAPFEVRFI